MHRTTSVLSAPDSDREPDDLTVAQAADGEIPARRLHRADLDAAVALMQQWGLSPAVIADRLRCNLNLVLAAVRRNRDVAKTTPAVTA